MNNKEYVKGLIFALFNTFSLGTLGLIDKIGTSQSKSPLIFSSQTTSIALVFTFVFALIYFNKSFIKNLISIPLSTWKYIFLVGLFGSGFFILFRFLGLTQSTGTFATLSQIVTTAITAILALIIFKEKLKKSFWFLFFIIMLSMYFVSTGKIALVTIKTGDMLIIIGTLFLAFANIFAKSAVKHSSPIILSLCRFFFGGIFLIFVGSIFFKQDINLLNFSIWSITSGFLWSVSVIAFNLAIKKIGVTLVTSLLMIAPTYTMVLEYIFLKHNFNFIQIISALVAIIAGIMLIIPQKQSTLISSLKYKDIGKITPGRCVS